MLTKPPPPPNFGRKCSFPQLRKILFACRRGKPSHTIPRLAATLAGVGRQVSEDPGSTTEPTHQVARHLDTALSWETKQGNVSGVETKQGT